MNKGWHLHSIEHSNARKGLKSSHTTFVFKKAAQTFAKALEAIGYKTKVAYEKPKKKPPFGLRNIDVWGVYANKKVKT